MNSKIRDMQYLKLDNAELNKQPKLSSTQKGAIQSLVSAINDGYKVTVEQRSETFQVGLENDINKLNRVLRLYGVQHVVVMGEKEDEIIPEVPVEGIPKEEGVGEEVIVPELVDYTPANGYYDGKVPSNDIDSNKWFYDADNVQWVGCPKDKDYASCMDDEIVRVSRYSMPDWEIYVPLEYQKSKNYKSNNRQYIPVQVPMGVKDNNKVRFTPRVGRSVGRVLQ
jgi:hypothetical protein